MIHEYIIKVDDEKRDIMGGMPLEEQPKELVRCKDCKHRGTWQCWQYFIGHKTEDDFFCADGERE